jgi:hypothetical protein
MFLRRFIVGATLALLALSSARAAVLEHDYTLRNTLSPASGGPPLSVMGGNITALGYVFAGNPVSIGTIPSVSSNISLEFSFTFRVQSGNLEPAAFTAVSIGPGIYSITSPLVLQPVAPSSPLNAPHDVNLHFVLTRNSATDAITGYVNGSPEFTLSKDVKNSPDAISAGFNFSLREGSSSTLASLGGRVDFVRVYNGALSPGEVSQLFASGAPLAIPEPETYALFGAGLIAYFLSRRIGKTKVPRT